MCRILFVLGTRPEAIKLCPVIACMRSHQPELNARVCVTAQHRDLLDQVLDAFAVQPDYDLNVMEPGQSLFASTSRMLAGLEMVLRDPFDLVVVQGDTSSTLCGALAGFYARIPVAHVEAGLRTGDFERPFPEEMNRVLATRLTSLHFAATEAAAENLRCEGVPNTAIRVTGNPVIDAVLRTSEALESGKHASPKWKWLDPTKKLILVTAHRRESFGEPFANICRALGKLSERPDVQIAYPVHPNPNVQAMVERYLRNKPNVVLLHPLPYVSFVDLMRRSYLLLTDSGGVQEEGPSLGKPVLVLRDTTERPEAVEAGVALLVGTEESRVVEETRRLLDDAEAYSEMARRMNPYGDGRASERIAAEIIDWLGICKPK